MVKGKIIGQGEKSIARQMFFGLNEVPLKDMHRRLKGSYCLGPDRIIWFDNPRLREVRVNVFPWTATSRLIESYL